MIYTGSDGVSKFSTKQTPKYKYKKANQTGTFWSDVAPPSNVGFVSDASLAKSLAAMKPYEDTFGIKLLNKMAQSQYGKNWREVDKKNDLKFFKKQLDKYEDWILENKRYPSPSEAYRLGLKQSTKTSRQTTDFFTDEAKNLIKKTYSSGEGGSKYIAKKLKKDLNFKTYDGTIRKYIRDEVKTGNIERVTKFETQKADPTLPKDRYNIIRKVTPRDLRGFKVGRTGTEVLAPAGSKYKITFNIPGSPETTKIPAAYRGTQYFTNKAAADKALAGQVKFSKDLAKKMKANQSLREILLEQVSAPNIEAEIARMKEYENLASAHRVSYKQIAKLGKLYNILNLGVEDPSINSGTIRKFENKLDRLYEEQRNLMRTAKRSINKGLEVPKNIQQRIDTVNKEISTVVDLTNGRIQGILVDTKNLKPSIYGVNAIKTYGMGFIDKPVKELTDVDLDEIRANMDNQIKAEYQKGPEAQQILKDRQILLRHTDKLAKPNYYNAIMAEYKNAPANERIQIETVLRCRKAAKDGGRIGFADGNVDVCVATKLKDEQNVSKLTEIVDNSPTLTKIKNLAQKALTILPKLGTPGKIAAGAVAGAAAIGALTYNKELGEFVNPLNDDKASQATVTEWIKDNPVKTVAGTSIGFSAQEIPGAYKKARELGRGRVRSALGITGALKPVLTTFGTPAMTALFEAPFAAKRLEEGETMTEVLTDPLGPALGMSFMEPFSKGAGVIRDAPKRTWGQAAKGYFDLSNVGKARPGVTSKILRMGMSPRVIAGASRFLGLPGLALSLGLTGYDAYKNYQNEEGMLYNFFNKNE